MGEVYLAQHRRVARRAAIKVLVPELSQNAAVLERFFNEARAASLIRHPGIVEILDCDLYLEQAYIVMEFLDGESFGGYLYRTGPLERDVPFLLGVGVAVAGAVGAAHATGIIHRDLKPDNIYLHLGFGADPAVAVKILDFGIAKLALQDGAPSQTSTGVMLGTPTYMSPEQCRGAGRVDSRSDIYSLGCILYEALCGWPPFVREGMGDLIIAHVAEAPVPPIEKVPSTPPALNDLILRMLAKSPDDRPQTMDDVVAALRECARQIGVSVDGPLRPRIPVERPTITVESALTQAPSVGSSGVETTPLGPWARPSASDGTPIAVAPTSSRSASVSASGRTAPRRNTAPPASDAMTTAARKTTTFSSTAAEIATPPKPASRAGRWAAVAAVAVVAVGGGVVVLRTRATPAPEPTAGLPGRDKPSAPPTATAPTGGVPLAPQPPQAPPIVDVASDTVRIDFQGLPAGATAMVDGQRAALPIRLARGPEVHRIVMKAPGESPRTLEFDGTRDRIVDFVAATEAPADGSHPHSTDRESGHHGGASSPGSGGSHKREKAPAATRTDREAITDI